MRRVMPLRVGLSEMDAAQQAELETRHAALLDEHQGADELPEAVEAELAAIERALDALGAKALAFRPEDVTTAP
jgi:hypothetical protein